MTGAARWKPFGLLVFVNFLWAAQYPAYKIASDVLPVGALNFWTFVFALAVLGPFLLLERTRKHALTGAQTRILGEDVFRFVVLGALGIIPPSVFLAWGISHSTAANASILSLTIPILMSGLAIVFLGEHMTWIRALSLIAGLGGTLVISAADLQHFSLSRELALGNAVVFLSGLGSACYNTYGKKLLERFSELELLVFSECVACLICLILTLTLEQNSLFNLRLYTPKVWAALGVLGVFSWGLAMVLWMRVLKHLEVNQVSVSIYLLPVFGLGLSVLLLDEKLHGSQLLGGLLVLAGTITLTVIEQAMPKEKSPNGIAPEKF